MKRLRILVYGRVQRVGYRDAVAELARKLGLKGTVKNLPDEVSIEIVAEGEEDKLKEFLKMIDIRDYSVDVEKIDATEEKPTGEFKYFKIIRGEANEELGERMDVAGRLLYKMLEKQDSTISEIRGMKNEVSGGFDTLDKKYHVVSEEPRGISNSLKIVADYLPKLLNKLEDKK